ncbi:MAG: hypothetical protein LBE80_06745, partial [Deltaproteobacteria bacterium]|nr:hypothetical protein [Deltaproteobacteria bacterium]
ELFEYLSATKIDEFKAVTGRGIFALESGVHVDGLLKEPSLYEPFAPEVVGARRYLSLGLHSGHKALLLKCDCLELSTSPTVIKGLLKKVKEKALALGRALTDSEFEILYSTVKVPRRPPLAVKKSQDSPKDDPSKPKAEKADSLSIGSGSASEAAAPSSPGSPGPQTEVASTSGPRLFH